MSTDSLHTLPNATLRANEARRLRVGLTMSAVVHVGLFGALMLWSTREVPERPPVYRVNLVGAPPGARQVGVVNQRPPTKAQSEQPAPAGVEQLTPPEKVTPTAKSSKAPPQVKATPTPTKSKTAGTKTPAATKTTAAEPPKAGAGATGGKGADVINLRTEGREFPDQAYLNNITRQVYASWFPKAQNAPYVTEVKFTIHRNGTVTDIEVVKRSGNRLYDIESMGTIEAVASARKFGPLPAVWTDDVLIVYFTFDYALSK
jgi:periplasmic protein TonB